MSERLRPSPASVTSLALPVVSVGSVGRSTLTRNSTRSVQPPSPPPSRVTARPGVCGQFVAATPREELSQCRFFHSLRAKAPPPPHTARAPTRGGLVGARSTAHEGPSQHRSLPLVGHSGPVAPSRSAASASTPHKAPNPHQASQFVAEATAAFERLHHRRGIGASTPNSAAMRSVSPLSSSSSTSSCSSSSPHAHQVAANAECEGGRVVAAAAERVARVRTNAGRNELLRVLFSHRIASHTHAAHEMLGRDPGELRRTFMLLVNRYGMRQMTLDDFHAMLEEVLALDDVARSDAHVLFEFFDANHSGMLDVEELMEGLRALALTEEALVLRFCRRIFAEQRNCRDTTLSFNEVALLVDAVLRHYHQDPELTGEANRVLADIWRHAHHGSVTVPLLRTVVQAVAPTLLEAIEYVDVGAVGGGGTAATDADFEVARMWRNAIGDAAERQPGEGPVRRMSVASQGSTSSAGAAAASSYGTPALPAIGGASNARRKTRTRSIARRRSVFTPQGRDELDLHHPKFRADIFRHDDWRRQQAALEAAPTSWFTMRGQLYRQLGHGCAEPVFEA